MAKASITGWLLAAVPALGFLALTKLVLSRPMAPEPAAETSTARSAVQPVTSTMDASAPLPVHATLHPSSTGEAIPDGLLPGARIVADAYRKATGTHITRDTLAERLHIPIHTAERLLSALGRTEPHRTASQVPARVNGNAVVEALA